MEKFDVDACDPEVDLNERMRSEIRRSQFPHLLENEKDPPMMGPSLRGWVAIERAPFGSSASAHSPAKKAPRQPDIFLN